MPTKNLLFVEKYRPKTVDECVLPPRLKDYFNAQIETGQLENMLFVGTAGCGKTTVAKAVCSQLKVDFLFQNASENTGIETVRTNLRDFSSTVSFNIGSLKCIILDEADRLSANAQDALKSFIEEFSGNIRFILTSNSESKVIVPLRSRCPTVDFTLTKEERNICARDFGCRVKKILETEGIEYDKKDVAHLVMTHFPDYRRCLGVIQRCSLSGTLVVTNSSAANNKVAIEELLVFLKEKNFSEINKWVTKHPEFDINALISFLYDKMKDIVINDSIPDFIVTLNKYDYQQSFCVDKGINILAMIIELFANVNFKR